MLTRNQEYQDWQKRMGDLLNKHPHHSISSLRNLKSYFSMLESSDSARYETACRNLEVWLKQLKNELSLESSSELHLEEIDDARSSVEADLWEVDELLTILDKNRVFWRTGGEQTQDKQQISSLPESSSDVVTTASKRPLGGDASWAPLVMTSLLLFGGGVALLALSLTGYGAVLLLVGAVLGLRQWSVYPFGENETSANTRFDDENSSVTANDAPKSTRSHTSTVSSRPTLSDMPRAGNETPQGRGRAYFEGSRSSVRKPDVSESDDLNKKPSGPK